jgi:hypothetical protein
VACDKGKTGRRTNAMNDYREMVKEQLGEGYTFLKAYNAFENSELRIIAKDSDGREHRYILTDGRLTEKP